MATDSRKTQLVAWLSEQLPGWQGQIEVASADASFRRYFRVDTFAGPRIAMDAPPDRESCQAFVRIAEQLSTVGLHTPRIYAQNLRLGFLLLEDLGQRIYLDELTPDRADNLYREALAALRVISKLPTGSLQPFDRMMIRGELALFRDWYLGRELQLEPEEADFCLRPLAEMLIDNALVQPQVWVHRDYHSRNLMVCEPNPGVLDFQDAVCGPLTYDLVSLLKDCYIRWPRSQVVRWVADHYEQLQRQPELGSRLPDFEQFLRWFDLMGVQRHMKAIGIFARLNHRDNKPGYLADIPRCFDYLAEQAEQCEPLAQLLGWIEQSR